MKDIAGEEYWSNTWENIGIAPAVNPRSSKIPNHTIRCFHKYFKKIFANNNKEKKLLEIGCGNSYWLPYFHTEYGFEIYGIDYSEIGCKQSKEILKREGVSGEIYCIDAFTPDNKLLNKFDVVISNGVVEHFSDTANTIIAFSKFVKPGGILITQIPNLKGILGYLQKKLNKPVYDVHVPMDKQDLENAVKKSGLEILNSTYLVSISFYVNLMGVNGKIKGYYYKIIFIYLLSIISKIVWLFEYYFGHLPVSKFFSPVIINVAIKK